MGTINLGTIILEEFICKKKGKLFCINSKDPNIFPHSSLFSFLKFYFSEIKRLM